MREDFTNISLRRLTKLHPQLQHSALTCYQKCVEKNIPLYITWTRRSVEEQDLLYRFGRDLPGKIQTYIRGDLSPHCHGLAIEFCLYNGKDLYEWPQCENTRYWRWMWIKVTKTFEQAGWTTGWRWQNFQPGYLENLLGKSVIQHKVEKDDTLKQSWLGYM